MKRCMFAIAVLLLAMLSAAVANAQSPTAIISHGRTLLPLRVIADHLGATTDYDYKSGIVTITLDVHIIKVATDSRIAYVDADSFRLDSAPMQKAGRMYVPARFISEALGARVDWNPARRTITVTAPAQGSALVVSVPR